MKKFLTMAVIALGIFFINFAQAEAREIYAFSETRGGRNSDTYVLTNTIEDTSYGKKVTLHTVGRNYNHSKYWEVGFMRKGTDIYVIWLPSTSTTLIASNGGDTVIKGDYVKILRIMMANDRNY